MKRFLAYYCNFLRKNSSFIFFYFYNFQLKFQILAYSFLLKIWCKSSSVVLESLIIGCVSDSVMDSSSIFDWTTWSPLLNSTLSVSFSSFDSGSKSTILHFDHLSGCDGCCWTCSFSYFYFMQTWGRSIETMIDANRTI